MASSDTISSTGILLDCGATSHMFMCRKYFTNYTKSSNEFVTVGGRNRVPVAGRGSINFSALLPNGRLSIILHNVLHIPHLGANLVSLGTLHRQGVSVRSLDNSLVLSKDGEELFRASLTHSASTLYNIQCAPPASNITYLAKSSSNMHLQYHRMGYLHPRAINPRYRQYSVKSLEASKKKVFLPFPHSLRAYLFFAASGYGPRQRDECGSHLSVIDRGVTQVVPLCGPSLDSLMWAPLAVSSSASEHTADIFFWQEVTSCYEEWEWPSTPGRSGYEGRRRRQGMVGCRTPILTSATSICEDGA